jgi:glycosyltransferase involved in cell wall biosynthesis
MPSAYSGIERVAEHLYPRLAERGHEITVYCRRGAVPDTAGAYRAVERVMLPALYWRSLETLSHNLFSTAHSLVRAGFDLVQFEALAAGLFSAAGRLRALPTVVRVHGLDWQRAKWGALASRVLRAGEAAAVRHADEIIVVSRDLQDYFARTWNRSVTYIPNGVSTLVAPTAGSSAALLAPFGLEPERYLIYTGRLVPEKRIEDVIAAFRRVDSPLRLAIVGESSYTDAYVNRLHTLAAADPRIVFTGFQDGAVLGALLGNAVVFVSPSELEGLPMSVLECLDAGVPAVLSDIPPHRELLDNVMGYDLFHAPGNVDALADRLRQVIGQLQYYRSIAAQAQRRVRRVFSWPAIVDRTEETYLGLVDRHVVRGRSSVCVDGTASRPALPARAS